jgi:hypothetical protein
MIIEFLRSILLEADLQVEFEFSEDPIGTRVFKLKSKAEICGLVSARTQKSCFVLMGCI